MFFESFRIYCWSSVPKMWACDWRWPGVWWHFNWRTIFFLQKTTREPMAWLVINFTSILYNAATTLMVFGLLFSNCFTDDFKPKIFGIEIFVQFINGEWTRLGDLIAAFWSNYPHRCLCFQDSTSIGGLRSIGSTSNCKLMDATRLKWSASVPTTWPPVVWYRFAFSRCCCCCCDQCCELIWLNDDIPRHFLNVLNRNQPSQP